MPLETLSPNAPVNIRNLTIESPRTPDPDPFKITEIDWQLMEKTLEHSVKNNNSRFAAKLASAMVILSPQKREHIVSSYNLSVDYFTHRVPIISEVGGNQSPLVGPEYYAAIKILFPGSDPHSYYDPFKIISNAQLEGEKVMKQFTDPAIPLDVLRLRFEFQHVLTLFPQIVRTEDILQEKVDLAEGLIRGSIEVPSFLSNFRLFIPENKLTLDMKEEDWDHLASRLAEARYKGNWLEFAQISKTVKILKADEVKITENGWEFKMPPKHADFQSAPPPMPETRRFK